MATKPRKILHLDLDAFFCAVEELHNPDLRGKCFVVGGQPSQRGVVLSASYPARRLGIHSAMPMGRAVRLCPGLLIVRPRHGVYSLASSRVMDHLRQVTPLIEQLSIDEAFLDVSDLPESAAAVARRLQTEIRDLFGLPCSIGVAANKLVAKTATDAGKARHKGGGPPFAILEVPPGTEAEFMAPLPAQALWGIGPKSAAWLAEQGIQTIGDLAELSPFRAAQLFGKSGTELVQRARGVDTRQVETSHTAKSISQERTYDRDVSDQAVLEDTLRRLAEAVGYRLRQDHTSGLTVRLKLRWSDFSTITRQVSLAQPTDRDGEIFQEVLVLFHQVWRKGRPVRLLGVGVARLGEPIRQLDLWDSTAQKEHRLLEAMDGLRERYGEKVVFKGADLQREQAKRKKKQGG